MASSENRFSFTAERLGKLVCPLSGRDERDGRIWVYDAKVDRLAYSVTETGLGAFFFYGRVKTRPVKKRLGTLEELNVEQARRRVAELNTEVAKGRDPFADEKAAIEKAKREATFGTLWDSYVTHNLSGKRPSTIEQFTRLYDEHLSKWKNRPIASITSTDVEQLKANVGAKHPMTANKLLTIISAMYVKRGHVFGLPKRFSPTIGVDRYKEKIRSRVLTVEELAAVLKSIDAESNKTVSDYLKMLIYTGQRKSTVAQMAWQNISMQTGIWRIPGETTKTGDALAITLIPDALAILKRRERSDPEDSIYVFPGRGFTKFQADEVKARRAAGESTRDIADALGISQTGVMRILSPRFRPRDAAPFNGAGKAWARVLVRADIHHATIHDVRRTFITNMLEAGVPLPTVSAAVGHKSPQTTAKHYAFASDKAVAKATRDTMAGVMANVKSIQRKTKSA